MLQIFQHGPDSVDSEDEVAEHSTCSDHSESELDMNSRGDDVFEAPTSKHARTKDLHESGSARTNLSQKSMEWFPWPSRILFLWLLRVNGAKDEVPSVKSMKDLDAKLQRLYGIQTFQYKGALEHIYYVNSLADIISQEMSNPRVRENLSFYPEDTSSGLDKDYYIFEPAMLRSGGGKFEVCEDQFLKSFPEIALDTTLYNATDVTQIEGRYILDLETNLLSPWKLTNPVLGNSWRQRANGARCLAFPIWLYCDDTSGNTSKRWNKHNSFLFTPAGLSRTEASKEYNVHFLATSNTAPPLEMLDGIADQIQDSQEPGIWAWDPETESPVLLIICVLALLGDNPMQSEFCCHIGLQGKFFCRVCKVKGKDASAEPSRLSQPSDSVDPESGNDDSDSDTGSVASASTTASKGGKKSRRQKLKESLQPMISRVTNFLKVISDLPQETMSPVWRIRSLDPHSDTPVEVLHVVLLGFVKYLWRDVIQNQIGKNDNKKRELEVQLSSVDVDGLGLDLKLSGHTLVQYYGSLTGSDFRKIAQVAPFVLKEFVMDDCYQTWIALSKLVPLIWQPEIDNLDVYLTTLKAEIEHFLLCTARWTVRWFNKPKFHILVHLPDHIRQFGPAMLFATETFESYNAIIRSKNIAISFAKQNCIRHMLSGGPFLDREMLKLDPDNDKKFHNPALPQWERVTQVQQYFRSHQWSKNHKVGPSAVDVVQWSSETVGRYLGLSESTKSIPTGIIITFFTSG
ncbi:hypothetical protein K435DRAFT_817010 [Dendrothele bispora CBS 962.96]|uniref:Uncharacterized protein n=1 Tax=Dendrothele bispora (strain CBS 962.96) TaxID=1314807 RepID=A0A4S8MNZ4_DENBC|nr:hypothetical protein K435DRAFT_817010 [Dendrothele bispora CBS 962.96]